MFDFWMLIFCVGIGFVAGASLIPVAFVTLYAVIFGVCYVDRKIVNAHLSRLNFGMGFDFSLFDARIGIFVDMKFGATICI